MFLGEFLSVVRDMYIKQVSLLARGLMDEVPIPRVSDLGVIIDQGNTASIDVLDYEKNIDRRL